MADNIFTSLRDWFPQYTVVPLWPDSKPRPALLAQYTEPVREVSLDPNAGPDREISKITYPEMLVMTPEVSNGMGLLVIPGGSYQRVAMDIEGIDTARTMCGKGYTVFVMTYRMPADGHDEGTKVSLADAQRAMRLIRSREEQWPLDHLGVVGFSCGGHVAASLATQDTLATYDPIDSVDELSARPDFACLMYPVITMDKTVGHPGSRLRLLGDHPTPDMEQSFSPEYLVTDRTPPCFLVHACNDPAVKVENSLLLWQALKAHNIATELHLFERGGHGFGIRNTLGIPVHVWPELMDNWLFDRFHFSRN